MATVADVMTTELVAVDAATSLETAARLLTQKRISGLPVLGAGRRPIGVVSLIDIVDPDHANGTTGYPLFYSLTTGEPIELGGKISVPGGRVSDVMSPFVLSIEASASLKEAGKRMLGEQVHRLLVMQGGELVGIVTMSDLLRGFVLE